MTIERKTVRNTQYLYFLYYDSETKGKKEIYCGPVTEATARSKARELERDHLRRQLLEIQEQLKDLEEQGLVESEQPACRPFVKWAGGKSQLLTKMESVFPRAFKRYFEPFLGGGSVFFYLAATRPKFQARLSDSNKDLMNAYEVIQTDVEKVIGLLTRRQREFSKLSKREKAEFYNKVRSEPPPFEEKVERARWFIFLNKTCYNGLYRVNQNGGFNVPYGDYKRVKLFDAENLRAMNKLLNRGGIKIFRSSYESALENADRGDFCYLDPPYYPAVENGFTSYTPEAFSKEDHKKLTETIDELTQRGCLVLVSNSATQRVRDLYQGYTVKEIDALRAINSDKKGRKGAKELLIRNYG